MPDPNEALAARMAQVAAAAREGVRVIPSTGEIIDRPFSTDPDLAVIPEAQIEPAPPMQPGVGTTFTPAPCAAPQPTFTETVTVTAEPEPQPAPEPIRVIAPPQETPRAEAPKPEPEIIEPNRNADGSPAPYAASTLGEIVNMLERGQFSHEAVQAFQALASGMREVADATQKRCKGTLTIKLNLTTEGEAFFVEADYAVKAPKLPRPRTLAWQQGDGRITPSQPKQQLLFGVAGTEHGDRKVRTLQEARVVREQ